jgi:glycosyltransferase involved in cell wall biosynthesis
VVDGFYELNKEVLDKYKDFVRVINLPVNYGLCRATNLGVSSAKEDLILIVNDDNVFPKNWDSVLLDEWQPNMVLTPNQIEPRPSIFNQFVIKDLGTPDTFNYEKFIEYSNEVSTNRLEESGSTLPIFMSKLDYLRLGGWDESYESGLVADWDFFLKCSLSGLLMCRTYRCNFYHFTSISVNSESRHQQEMAGHLYAKFKWGTHIKHNQLTNKKHL